MLPLLGSKKKFLVMEGFRGAFIELGYLGRQLQVVIAVVLRIPSYQESEIRRRSVGQWGLRVEMGLPSRLVAPILAIFQLPQKPPPEPGPRLPGEMGDTGSVDSAFSVFGWIWIA